jgi:hypothetical protein
MTDKVITVKAIVEGRRYYGIPETKEIYDIQNPSDKKKLEVWLRKGIAMASNDLNLLRQELGLS